MYINSDTWKLPFVFFLSNAIKNFFRDMEVSTTTKIVGWITEQFIKYELNKLTVRNFFIGTTAVSILAYFGKKGYAFITEKKLPTSGFVLVTGGLFESGFSLMTF